MRTAFPTEQRRRCPWSSPPDNRWLRGHFSIAARHRASCPFQKPSDLESLRGHAHRVLHRSLQLWVSCRRSLHTNYMPEMSSTDRQLIKRFGKKSCASPVICGRTWRARRKFWCLATRALRRRFGNAAVHGYFAVTRMNKMRPRFGFHERRVREQLTV